MLWEILWFWSPFYSFSLSKKELLEQEIRSTVNNMRGDYEILKQEVWECLEAEYHFKKLIKDNIIDTNWVLKIVVDKGDPSSLLVQKTSQFYQRCLFQLSPINDKINTSYHKLSVDEIIVSLKTSFSNKSQLAMSSIADRCKKKDSKVSYSPPPRWGRRWDLMNKVAER